LCDERHPCDISRGYHRSHHFTEGTQLSVIPTITSLVASTDTLVAKRPTLSIGALFDESLYIANAALTPTGTPYTATDYNVCYRTAASTWVWKKSSMPFSYNAGTGFIQWDNAGTLTDGAGGTGGNARWFNSYLVQTDAVNDGLGYVWISGRGSFTSLALAQAEDPASFSMTGFPLLEYGIAIQLTWAINATYTSSGKCVFITSKQVKSGNMITGLTSVVLAPSATIDTTNADNITAGILLSNYGGTGNGFTKFTGPTTSEKTFTLPNSNETLLYSGGALGTPVSGNLSACTGVPESGFKNIIINGGFTVNQRGYASAATLAAGAYGHDRWKAGAGGGDYSFTQLASNTTITIAANKTLIQVIEDKNVFRTTYTLSWTGTAQARYAVNSATPAGAYAASPIVITGQTVGTTMSVEFNAGTLGNVDLEPGSIATAFPYRSYSQELALCQRYYQKYVSFFVDGYNAATGNIFSTIVYPVQMRAAPTINYSNQAYGNASGLTTHVSFADKLRVYYTITGTGGGYVDFNFDATAEF
jgi:hypothetical protein